MKLWKHQEETIEKALKLGSLALLQDPGVGKTLSTIKIIEGLWHKYDSKDTDIRTSERNQELEKGI